MAKMKGGRFLPPLVIYPTVARSKKVPSFIRRPEVWHGFQRALRQ